MFRVTVLLSIGIVWLVVTDVAHARIWPDGKGGTCQAELILVRKDDIILRPKAFSGKLLVVPKDKLRKVDLSYLSRLFQSQKSDPPAGLPAAIRVIAKIRDAESLISAASFFRRHDMGFVRETYTQYVRNMGTETDKLWYLARVLFEHRPDQRYPDFWNDKSSLVKTDWCGCSYIDARLRHGLPFIWVTPDATSGPNCPDDRTLLDWVNNHARMRDSWIKPDLPAREFFAAFRDGDSWARHQALRIIDEHFDVNWQCVFEESLDDQRWLKLVELVEVMNLKWDDEKQKFIRQTDAPVPKPPEEWIPNQLILAIW